MIWLLFIIQSCVPDPSIEFVDYFNFEFETESGIKRQAGESFDVTYKAINLINPSENYVKVTFSVVSGGGYISAGSLFTDDEGKATVNWQLGSVSSEQLLRASVFKATGEYMTSTEYIAYALRENEWDAISCKPDAKISDMITDTVNMVTFMISSGKLYKQGTKYFEWEKVDDENVVSPHIIEIDCNQVIYISTWNGELIKSTDHGESWSKCNKPYPENLYYFYMYVSNDNYIWAGKFDFPTMVSKDGGNTWQNAGDILPSHINEGTFRLKNGILVNHGTKGTSTNRLNISYDDGLTWISRETPGYSTIMYVNENDEIFIGTQDIGFTIYQTTDLGETYTKIHSVFPQWGGSTENNIFIRWRDFYYVIIPGYGILKSDDLIHYENYWRNSELSDLFIDHNGVLIAKHMNYKTVYYRKNSQ